MNVAIATWAAPSASAVMTARSGGNAADEGAGTGTLASATTSLSNSPAVPVVGDDAGGDAGRDDPLVNRYPRIGVTFNNEASRLIILFRDPATGQAIDQIPSEVALKQYIEAQQKEKTTASPRYDTVVGGTPGAPPAADGGAVSAVAGQGGGSAGRSGDGASRAGSGGTHTASLRLAAVNGSLPAAGATPTPAVRVQAPASGMTGGGGSPGVNLTI